MRRPSQVAAPEEILQDNVAGCIKNPEQAGHLRRAESPGGQGASLIRPTVGVDALIPGYLHPITAYPNPEWCSFCPVADIAPRLVSCALTLILPSHRGRVRTTRGCEGADAGRGFIVRDLLWSAEEVRAMPPFEFETCRRSPKPNWSESITHDTNRLFASLREVEEFHELHGLAVPVGAPEKRARRPGVYHPRTAAPVVYDESMTCQCAEGWICETRPGRPWPHDESAGPGMPARMMTPWWRGPPPAALDTSD